MRSSWLSESDRGRRRGAAREGAARGGGLGLGLGVMSWGTESPSSRSSEAPADGGLDDTGRVASICRRSSINLRGAGEHQEASLA